MIKNDPDFSRKLADLELAIAVEGRRIILDEHSASYRWIVASLLAVNGGALVSTVPLEFLPNSTKIYSCAAYYVGIILALLCAVFNQRINRRAIQPMGEMAGIWLAAAHTASIDESVQTAIEERKNKATQHGWKPQVAGWLSALAFSLGILISGNAMWNLGNQPSPTACEKSSIK